MHTIERPKGLAPLVGSSDRGWLVRFLIGAIVFAAVVVGTMAQIANRTLPFQVQTPEAGFWTQIHVNGAYEPYGSLGAMADAASAVVVGHFDAVSKGRVFDPEPEYGDRGAAFYLNATFVVDDVLRGSLADPSTNTITVELFVGSSSEVPKTAVPTDRQILFLINKAAHPTNANLSAQQRTVEARYYEILGGQVQGRLTIAGNTVEVSDAISPGEFPSDLAGQSPDTVIESIRDLK
jgi:hypothetical protein